MYENLEIRLPRRERIKGREYLVVPVSLLREGVLSGSSGPLFYPADAIARSARDWDNIPMTLNHPRNNGSPAYVDQVADPKILGFVKVPRIDAQGRLSADAWFNVEATRKISPSLLQSVEQGKQIEVSTGLASTKYDLPRSGRHKGVWYDDTIRSIIPDHLAVLVDERGACSLQDGCGIWPSTPRVPAFSSNSLESAVRAFYPTYRIDQPLPFFKQEERFAMSTANSNQVDDDDDLPEPTLNWAEIVAQRSQTKAPENRVSESPAENQLPDDDEGLPEQTIDWAEVVRERR